MLPCIRGILALFLAVTFVGCAEHLSTPDLFLPKISMTNVRMAFMGVDPVIRFPNGVYDRTLGALVAGDLNYKANYEGAVFAFTSETTLAMFEKNPEHYIPEVGGYCLGAMSQRRITPGDPRNFFFVPEEDGGGMWAVFGSPNGPAAWSAMTTQERKERLAEAHAYYNGRIGIVPIKPDGS